MDICEKQSDAVPSCSHNRFTNCLQTCCANGAENENYKNRSLVTLNAYLGLAYSFNILRFSRDAYCFPMAAYSFPGLRIVSQDCVQFPRTVYSFPGLRTVSPIRRIVPRTAYSFSRTASSSQGSRNACHGCVVEAALTDNENT